MTAHRAVPASLKALALVSLAITAAPTPAASAGSAPDGAALYAQRCAGCHDQPRGHLPSREALANRSPINIVMTLRTGMMQPQAAGLSAEEDNAIAAFLTAGAKGPPLRPNTCRQAGSRATGS